METSSAVLKALAAERNSAKAAFFPRFFKTGKGEYGEGDLFWGISVPDNRGIAKKYYAEISIDELSELLQNAVHEVRACALFMMIYRFENKKLPDIREHLFKLYTSHSNNINNWDLVDSSAAQIVGSWLFDKKRDMLYSWAKKEHLWEQRIAIIATFHFIKKNQFEDTVAICKLLLYHKHDLIHKATGWMLREVGKRNEDILIYFLAEHYKEMPRTMLRYAIEKLPESKRKRILEGKYF